MWTFRLYWFLPSVETVCFSFFPVGRAFIVLRELDSFRWSRMRDVAAEIKLRSQAFPIIWILLDGSCLWNVSAYLLWNGFVGLSSMELNCVIIFYGIDSLDYLLLNGYVGLLLWIGSIGLFCLECCWTWIFLGVSNVARSNGWNTYMSYDVLRLIYLGYRLLCFDQRCGGALLLLLCGF